MNTMNTVSIQIPEAELQAVKEALATLKSTLDPHLIALSPAERQTVP
jgi:hypothetical protein